MRLLVNGNKSTLELSYVRETIFWRVRSEEVVVDNHKEVWWLIICIQNVKQTNQKRKSRNELNVLTSDTDKDPQK